MNRVFIKFFMPFLLILGIILGLFASSSLNGSDSAALSTQVSEFFQTILGLELEQEEKEFFHYFLRKSAHFFSFLLLSMGFCGLFRGKKHPYCWAVLFSFAFAVADEYHQYLGGTRNGSVNDVILDTTGALTGAILYSVLSFLIKQRRISKKEGNREIIFSPTL